MLWNQFSEIRGHVLTFVVKKAEKSQWQEKRNVNILLSILTTLCTGSGEYQLLVKETWLNTQLCVVSNVIFLQCWLQLFTEPLLSSFYTFWGTMHTMLINICRWQNQNGKTVTTFKLTKPMKWPCAHSLPCTLFVWFYHLLDCYIHRKQNKPKQTSNNKKEK